MDARVERWQEAHGKLSIRHSVCTFWGRGVEVEKQGVVLRRLNRQAGRNADPICGFVFPVDLLFTRRADCY